MLALLLVDVRVEVGELPASSAISEASQTPTPPVTPVPAPARPATPSKTSPGTQVKPKQPVSARRFAWAPTDGASAYYVEFFRGSTRVYAQETTGPTLEVPARWRYEGVQRSFHPGEYRWYVWPIVGGQRASRAAVQTTVPIPRR